MENKNGNFHDFSMEDAARIAQSDTAKQLFALLKQQNGDLLQTAMQQASAGNFNGVKDTVSQLLSNPEAAQLLSKMKE